MNPLSERHVILDRRRFLHGSALGLGSVALAALLHESTQGQTGSSTANAGLPGLPHFAPRARRVIYLFQSGAPSQMDLFDYKPGLRDLRGTELPASIRMGQRLTGMTATQESFQ